MMRTDDSSATSATLLRKIRDWRDGESWARFKHQYEPLLRACCRRFRLDDDAVDEVCQLTWITVANHMERFVYDPRQSFRGWLWRVCHNTAIDYLRVRKSDLVFALDDRDEIERVDELVDAPCSADKAAAAAPATWLRHVEIVQAAVKAKVQPQTWEAFWLFHIRSWTVEETAAALGIGFASVYKAKQRVLRQLEDEGRHIDFTSLEFNG
jgi:RNA polymerase sigma-70 factor (ECF subfamily)